MLLCFQKWTFHTCVGRLCGHSRCTRLRCWLGWRNLLFFTIRHRIRLTWDRSCSVRSSLGFAVNSTCRYHVSWSPPLLDFHLVVVRLEVWRSCIELGDVWTTVLVLHTSSYWSCTYDMSNLVHNEMFIAFPQCDQPTLIEMFVVFLSQQPRELLQVFDPMAPSTRPSRRTEGSQICMDFLWDVRTMSLLFCVADICWEARLNVSASMLQKSGQPRPSSFPARRKAGLCTDAQPVALFVRHVLEIRDSWLVLDARSCQPRTSTCQLSADARSLALNHTGISFVNSQGNPNT